eukprot:2724781-Rhodomonas_salina.1
MLASTRDRRSDDDWVRRARWAVSEGRTCAVRASPFKTLSGTLSPISRPRFQTFEAVCVRYLRGSVTGAAILARF